MPQRSKDHTALAWLRRYFSVLRANAREWARRNNVICRNLHQGERSESILIPQQKAPAYTCTKRLIERSPVYLPQHAKASR